MKHHIFTRKAQQSESMPYSQAIKAGNTIYVSGQGPFDPESGQLVGETIQEQTRRALANVEEILLAGGATLADVVQVTVFLNGDYFDEFNAVYKECFTAPYPARTVVGSNLGKNFLVEVDAVAVLDE